MNAPFTSLEEFVDKNEIPVKLPWGEKKKVKAYQM